MSFGPLVSGGGYVRSATPLQSELLASDLGFDDGGRYALVAVSGYEIRFDDGLDQFGTVFSIIDTDSGDEVDISPVVPARSAHRVRRRWIALVMHMNGKDAA